MFVGIFAVCYKHAFGSIFILGLTQQLGVAAKPFECVTEVFGLSADV